MKNITELGQRVTEHLTKELLSFWLEKDRWKEKDAFYGFLDGRGNLSQGEGAPWHAVLFSRLLWTFSAAARFTGDRGYLLEADKVFRIYHSHFLDKEYGGAYWLVSPDGDVIDDKKQAYGIAFWIYGLSEYHLACGNEQALRDAIDLFTLMQRHIRDPRMGGPTEARARDWSPLDAASLGLNDATPRAPKSMNTHLHVLEAYTNLLRAWPTAEMKEATREVLNNFLDYVADPSGYFHMFLDMDYTPWEGLTSYGHDIEGSWLLWEAAEVIDDKDLLRKARPYCLKLCERPVRFGIDLDGGIIDEGDYEGHPVRTGKVWWSQAEAVVGQINYYELTGDGGALQGAMRTWEFIEQHIIDHEYGEWFESVSRDTAEVANGSKVGPWKCPYHNSRMCMEVARRVRKILEEKGQGTANGKDGNDE